MPVPSVSIAHRFIAMAGAFGAAGLSLLAVPGHARTISPAVNAQVPVTIPPRNTTGGAYAPSEPGRTWTWSPAVNGRVYVSVPLREPSAAIWRRPR